MRDHEQCNECDLPVLFSKMVVQRREARGTACRMMEQACLQQERAEEAETEVKHLQHIITCLGMEIADLHTALGMAVDAHHGCPRDEERQKACRAKGTELRDCRECRMGFLIDQARLRREAALA